MDRPFSLATFFTLLSFSFFSELQVQAAEFRIVNKCRYPVWPGLLSGANSPQLPTTGFLLKSGSSETLTVPRSWSGRLWARTQCRRDHSSRFFCATGDCGSGRTECGGGGAKPPATLAEFTLNGGGGLDFYDVSLVDGYNLPMLVVAKRTTRGGPGPGPGSGTCSATGCLVDLNGACPAQLAVGLSSGGRRVGCMSACEAFRDSRYCCSDAYATPETCGPSVYSEFFKHACPRAYSYAYDDKTSTFTCASADYLIVFCPSPYTSQKLLGARRLASELPLVNKTTMYIRSHHSGGGSSLARASLRTMVHVASVLAAAVGLGQLL